MRVHSKSRKARAELLVDGDQRGIAKTKQAIELLQGEGWNVKTTIFAPPERAKNKKWQSFLSEPGTCLEAVPRGTNVEAVDVAISDRLLYLAENKNICLALLTTDVDFVVAVQTILALGSQIVVLIPEGAASSIRTYELAGARVLPLPRIFQGGPKVRAILHAHGGGSVKKAEPWVYAAHDSADFEELSEFLQLLKYRTDRGHLEPSIAKFLGCCSGVFLGVVFHYHGPHSLYINPQSHEIVFPAPESTPVVGNLNETHVKKQMTNRSLGYLRAPYKP